MPNYLLQREHRGTEGSTNLYDYDTLSDLFHSTQKSSPVSPKIDGNENASKNEPRTKKKYERKQANKHRRYVNYHSPVVYNSPAPIDEINEIQDYQPHNNPLTEQGFNYEDGDGMNPYYTINYAGNHGYRDPVTPMVQYYQPYPVVSHSGYQNPPIAPVPSFPIITNNLAEQAAVVKMANRPYYNRYNDNTNDSNKNQHKDVMIMMTPQKFEKLAMQGLRMQQQANKTVLRSGENTEEAKNMTDTSGQQKKENTATEITEEMINEKTVKQRREREEKLARQILSGDKIKALKSIRGLRNGAKRVRGGNVDLSPDGPVMGLITSFAEHDKDSPDCQKMALCILALKGAEKTNATRFESFLWSLATL